PSGGGDPGGDPADRILGARPGGGGRPQHRISVDPRGGRPGGSRPPHPGRAADPELLRGGPPPPGGLRDRPPERLRHLQAGLGPAPWWAPGGGPSRTPDLVDTSLPNPLK